MTKKFTWHFDGGHEWLEVKLSELKEVIDISEISRFSYADDTNAYLEGDCDAGKFLRKLESEGHTFEWDEVDHGENAFIRGLAPLNSKQPEMIDHHLTAVRNHAIASATNHLSNQ